MSKFTPDEIHAAIRKVRKGRVLDGGNCARFAHILNRVVGGKGVYLIANGEHYEFADHVALLHEGVIYDGVGRTTRAEFEARWGSDDEDEDDQVTFEEFVDEDPKGSSVLALADPGIFPFDGEEIENELRDELATAKSREMFMPKTLTETEHFRVEDHDTLGVKISFVWNDGVGGAQASKWFTDDAAKQLRSSATKGKLDDDLLLRRCSLDHGEVLPLAGPAPAP